MTFPLLAAAAESSQVERLKQIACHCLRTLEINYCQGILLKSFMCDSELFWGHWERMLLFFNFSILTVVYYFLLENDRIAFDCCFFSLLVRILCEDFSL